MSLSLEEEFAKCAINPVYFINTYIKLSHLIRGLVPMNLTFKQEIIINKLDSENRTLSFELPRQSGKTSALCAFLVWKTMFNSDQTILLCGNSVASAKEKLHIIKIMYDNLPIFLRKGITEYNLSSMKFDNHSQLLVRSVSDTTGRGLSLSMVIVDDYEVANPTKIKDFWTSMLPCIRHSQLILTSSSKEEEMMKMCSTISFSGNSVIEKEIPLNEIIF
jgi:hypothetical protein